MSTQAVETPAALLPIERVRSVLGLTYAEIARALSIDESTLHRWRASFDRRRASAGLQGIVGLDHFIDAYTARWPGDTSTAKRWLSAPHVACGGDTPRSWLLNGRADFLAGLLSAEGIETCSPIANGITAARADATFDLAPVGMARVALDGEFLAVNARLCEILGWSASELRGKTGQEITHLDDLDSGLDLGRQLVSGAVSSITQQKRYRRADGRSVWTRVSATVVRDELGAPLHFLTVVYPLPDIEAAAVRLALGHAPGAEGVREGVWEWEVQSGDLYWSPQIATTLGRSPHDIAHSVDAFRSLVHPADLPGMVAAAEAYAAGQARTYDVEIRMAHTDGSWRWVHSRGRALSRDADGRPTRVAGLHTDVTDRRLAEEQLRESHAALASSEAHYRAIVEGVISIMWKTTAEGRYLIEAAPVSIVTSRGPTHVFTSGTPLFRTESANGVSVRGLNVRDAQPELAHTGLYELLDDVYATGQARVSRDFSVPVAVTGNAVPSYFNLMHQPVRDTAGAVIGIVSVASDITSQVPARHLGERPGVTRTTGQSAGPRIVK